MNKEKEKLIYDLKNKNDEFNVILQVALNNDVITFEEYIQLVTIFNMVNKELYEYEVKIK